MSRSFNALKQVRGDNYCALRATLYQVLATSTKMPTWLHDEGFLSVSITLYSHNGWVDAIMWRTVCLVQCQTLRYHSLVDLTSVIKVPLERTQFFLTQLNKCLVNLPVARGHWRSEASDWWMGVSPSMHMGKRKGFCGKAETLSGSPKEKSKSVLHCLLRIIGDFYWIGFNTCCCFFSGR